MSEINIAGVDLNLLKVFEALIQERNVTRAAGRLGITQPGLSHALGRLRQLLGDELFVRTPRGMQPTSRALEMAPAVSDILGRVREVVAGDTGFDPAAARQRFTLGLSDYAAYLLLPRLLARLEREAPGATILVRHTSHSRGLGMLADLEAELIVGNFPPPPGYLRAELLWRDGLVCAVRRGHPVLGRNLNRDLDLETYLAMRHLHVSLQGEPKGYLDDVLAARGLRRNIVATVGHFLVGPLLLGSTDYIATEPEKILRPLSGPLGLTVLPPPLEIPRFPVVQAWHQRHERDPAQRWLRQVVREVGADIAADGSYV